MIATLLYWPFPLHFCFILRKAHELGDPMTWVRWGRRGLQGKGDSQNQANHQEQSYPKGKGLDFQPFSLHCPTPFGGALSMQEMFQEPAVCRRSNRSFRPEGSTISRNVLRMGGGPHTEPFRHLKCPVKQPLPLACPARRAKRRGLAKTAQTPKVKGLGERADEACHILQVHLIPFTQKGLHQCTI